MAARSPSREQKDPCRLATLLSSAFFEWLLIIMLFLAAILSYLATRLARFCKLQTPCLFCSRLDHIWGNEKAGFYKDLLCNTHKLEVASLAYCHIHRKLGDVQGMCEGCLLSFATEKNLNPEACKLLVGKLRVDMDEGDQNVRPKLPATLVVNGLRNKFYGEDMVKIPLLKKDLEPGSLCTKYCSCCSEAFRSNPSGHSLLQRRLIESDVAEIGIPLSSKTGHTRPHQRRGKSSRSPPIDHLGNQDFDCLSHFGYRELKINSDSESEVPFSDEDDGSGLAHGTEDLKEELVDRCLQPVHATLISKGLSATSSADTVQEKLIHPTRIVPDPSLIALERSQAGEYRHKSSVASNVAIGHGLEEINWSQVEERFNHSAPSGFIPEQIPTESSNAKLHVMQIGDEACISTTLNGEVTKVLSSTDMNSKRIPITNEPSTPLHSNMDLNDASKLSIGNMASPPPTSTEIVTGKEATKVQEDLRLLLSQISAARGLEFPMNEMSPSPRLSNASSTTGSQNSKRLYDESSLESLYAIVGEVEGETPVDRMKRQIELDRKSLTVLFKELEEERSASAIAANQTMAMINRLQEEKAAMQMEAWQYQRMMEEQAEYDQEALEKLNDLLAEREKDIQDLEAEVDSYRKRFGEEPLGDSVERDYSRTSTPRFIRSASRQNSYRSIESGFTGSRFMKDSLMDIEDEKAYMLQCLKRLEKKLELFSTDGEDGLPPCEDINGNGQLEAGIKNTQFSEEPVDANEVVLEKKDSYLSGEDSSSIPSSQSNAKENHKEGRLCYSSSSNNMQYPMIGKTCDLIVLGDEVSQLNERLEALEADRDFLDRAINSLKNGSDGVQFIREIACHLRELRRIGIRLRKNIIAEGILISSTVTF